MAATGRFCFLAISRHTSNGTQLMSYRPGSDPPPSPGDRRSLFTLVRELVDDASGLVRQEITLVRIELLENARRLAKNSGLTAAGGVIALLGFLVLVEFLIIGLGVLLGGSYWLSSLLVALALLTLGVGAAFLGLRKIGRASIAPTQSLASAKQTGQWLATEAQDLRKVLRDGDLRISAGENPVVGPPASPGTPAREPSSLPQRLAQSSAAASEGLVVRVGTVPAPSRMARTRATGADGQSLVRRVIRNAAANDLLGQGAKIAFFMFMSIPPALLVVFGLSSIFGGVELAESLTARIDDVVAGSVDDPNSAAAFVSNFIRDVVTTSAPGPLSIGLVLGLWAASAVFVALTDALNRAFDIQESRSWGRRRLLAIFVMITFALLFLGASAMLIAGPLLAGAVGLAGAAEVAWSVLQWPFSFLLVVAAFFLIYYTLPNHDLSGATPMLLRASAIAAATWVLATLAFRVYVVNFASYGETYGVVGGVLVLLLWTYLTSIVILVGVEIAAELERTG